MALFPAANWKKGITRDAVNHCIALTWSYKWKFSHHDVIKMAFCFLERAIAPLSATFPCCPVTLISLLTSPIYSLLFHHYALFFHSFFFFFFLLCPLTLQAPLINHKPLETHTKKLPGWFLFCALFFGIIHSLFLLCLLPITLLPSLHSAWFDKTFAVISFIYVIFASLCLNFPLQFSFKTNSSKQLVLKQIWGCISSFCW